MIRFAAILLAAPVLAWDLAINNGRVIDPESGLDAVRHLAIEDGRIARVSRRVLKADEVIDATGLVVAPGFIDLHAHGQDAVSNRFQAGDGVTSALELEIGTFPVDDWYKSRAGKAPLNFGTTVSHLWTRAVAQGLPAEEALTTAVHAPLTDEQHQRMLDLLRQGVEDGALGIGVGITYTPAADHAEILSVFELAAELDRPVFVHLRSSKFMDGDLLGPLQEVLANAVVTGASLHVVHINSSLDEAAPTAVSMIRRLQAQGFDITTENYPYTAGSTRLESAFFDSWTEYGKLQWVATGERLTKISFDKYRQEGGWVIIHGRSKEINDWLVAQLDLIIASDGIPFVDGLSHPRSAGTYAKILGRYVREEKKLTLMQALAKMTIMPARRLEGFVPAMKNKGRIRKGADADITIFNSETIIDRATYTKPGHYSDGIDHVLVGGVPVVSDGRVLETSFPGSAVRINDGRE